MLCEIGSSIEESALNPPCEVLERSWQHCFDIYVDELLLMQANLGVSEEGIYYNLHRVGNHVSYKFAVD